MSDSSKKISWNPAFETGHARIDAEHRRLVAILNDLAEAVETGRGEAVLAAVLTRLQQYCSHHFANEEAYMEEVGYEHIDHHRKLHTHLAETVAAYRHRLETGERIRPIEILNFLSDWLVNHIQKEDRKILPRDREP